MDPLLGEDVVDGGEDEHPVLLGENFAARRVNELQPVDLVAEELDADRVLLVGGKHLDDISPDAEVTALEGHVVAGVLHAGQRQQHLAAVDGLAPAQGEHVIAVVARGAEAEDAAHRRDDDDVVAGEQVARGGQAQAVEVVVARGVLLDVDVALRDVGLGLVVVVVADEIADRVVGKQLPHLLVELGRQRLVVADDEGRLADALDDVGHREGLAGPGGSEQCLAPPPGGDALDEGVDRGRLVAGRGELADDLKRPGARHARF